MYGFCWAWTEPQGASCFHSYKRWHQSIRMNYFFIFTLIYLNWFFQLSLNWFTKWTSILRDKESINPLIAFLLICLLSPDHNWYIYRWGTVNLNTVNSKFHLIRSYCEIFFYNFPNIPCLKYTVNSNFHLIRSKTLPTKDFEWTVPDLYVL